MDVPAATVAVVGAAGVGTGWLEATTLGLEAVAITVGIVAGVLSCWYNWKRIQRMDEDEDE